MTLPKPGESVLSIPPEELVEYCGKNLATYKIPRYFEYRTEDFERTPSMRVQKQSLKQGRDDQIKGCWDREKGSMR